MGRESSREDVDPNYKAKRHQNRTEAQAALGLAKVYLDSVLRGTEDANIRTVVSTAYDVVVQAETLVYLSGDMDTEDSEKKIFDFDEWVITAASSGIVTADCPACGWDTFSVERTMTGWPKVKELRAEAEQHWAEQHAKKGS
jgi:hypothetical protein